MKTILNIKIDQTLKTEAQKTAKELGLPLSVVLNNYLKEFVVEKEVVFSINAKTAKKLSKISTDLPNKKNLSETFTSPDKAISWLNKNAD